MNNIEVITEGLQTIFSNLFEIAGKIDNIDMNHISDWDSLKHIQLLSAIDEYFKIEISFEDAIEMISVKEIIKIIDKYLSISKK